MTANAAFPATIADPGTARTYGISPRATVAGVRPSRLARGSVAKRTTAPSYERSKGVGKWPSQIRREACSG